MLIEPIRKIDKSIYICDNKFHLDNILEMYTESQSYGCTLISGNRTMIYEIEKAGQNINYKLLKDMDVRLIKKQRKGGQSAQRFGRLREENEHYQILNIIDEIKKCYKNKNIKGILIAGPAELKKKVAKEDEYHKYFNKLTLGIINSDTIDEETIRQVYENNFELFVNQENQEWIKKIRELLAIGADKLVFGKEIKKSLEECMLETLITYDKTKYQIAYNCNVIEIDINALGFNEIGIKWY